METNQLSASKEQELQARKNKKQADSTKAEIIKDKKMEGPNRPSV
jgi:hypothetical protein